jgi:hypothetical protein
VIWSVISSGVRGPTTGSKRVVSWTVMDILQRIVTKQTTAGEGHFA